MGLVSVRDQFFSYTSFGLLEEEVLEKGSLIYLTGSDATIEPRLRRTLVRLVILLGIVLSSPVLAQTVTIFSALGRRLSPPAPTKGIL